MYFCGSTIPARNVMFLPMIPCMIEIGTGSSVITPITETWPPGRTMFMHSVTRGALPTASIAESAPRPFVSPATTSERSCFVGLTVTQPRAAAFASRPSSRSTAITAEAPNNTAER